MNLRSGLVTCRRQSGINGCNCALGLALLLTLMAPAYSQQAPAQTATLEEVIVTAQKRSENLKDVPLSVSVMSGDEIRDKGLKNMNEVSLYAPNTRIAVGGSGGSVKMRGLGSGNNSGFEQAVAFIIDGIYYGRVGYMRGGLVDINSIEILRGPQGTLMGKNAVAGAVNMSTADPHQEWALDLTAAVGERNRKSVTAVVNAPLIEDALSLRLAAKQESYDGWYQNETLDRDSLDLDSELYRIKLGLEAIDNLNVVLQYQEASDSIFSQSLEMIQANEGTLAINREYRPDFEAEQDYRNWGDGDTPAVIDTKIGSLKVEYEWGEHLFTAISGWSELGNVNQLDGDGGPIPLITSGKDEHYEQASQEFRITSPEGDIDYVAGLFLFDSSLEHDNDIGVNTTLGATALASQRNPRLVVPGFSNTPSQIDHSLGFFDQTTQSAALFGQVRWNLPDLKLTFLGGLRYSVEEKEAQMSRRFEGNDTVFTQVQGQEAFDTERSRVERDFSPKISVTYAFSDDINLYTTYAKAFKAGGFNPSANTADQFEYNEEQSETWELGAKGQLLGGLLRLNFATFYTEFSGLQLASYDGTNFIVRNAADATTKGAELDTTLLAARGLILKLSVGYTDARYDSFPTGQCPVGQGDVCDLSGRQFDRAPLWTGTLGFAYKRQLGDWPIDFIAGLDANYQGSQYTADDLDPESIQGEYVKFNGRLGFQDLDGKWKVTLVGTNLSDEATSQGTADVPLQPGSYFAVFAEPRTAYLEFRYRY